jgi:hypothetical protein
MCTNGQFNITIAEWGAVTGLIQHIYQDDIKRILQLLSCQQWLTGMDYENWLQGG